MATHGGSEEQPDMPTAQLPYPRHKAQKYRDRDGPDDNCECTRSVKHREAKVPSPTCAWYDVIRTKVAPSRHDGKRHDPNPDPHHDLSKVVGVTAPPAQHPPSDWQREPLRCACLCLHHGGVHDSPPQAVLDPLVLRGATLVELRLLVVRKPLHSKPERKHGPACHARHV